MAIASATFVKNRLCLDFAALKNASPKGIYLAPLPEEPLTWTGVMFPRKGPFTSAVLRFHIIFGDRYPEQPPVIVFSSDVFHPLVTPLTTYTHTTRDAAADTGSSASADRLPPGGFTLRHGFPEWYESAPQRTGSHGDSDPAKVPHVSDGSDGNEGSLPSGHSRSPHIVEILQYLRVAFDTEEVIDSIPLDIAANSGAWHAWRSFRARVLTSKVSPSTGQYPDGHNSASERSMSPTQQPGGARRPGEWNWQGVWQARVRKAIEASTAEAALFGGDSNDIINFHEPEADA